MVRHLENIENLEKSKAETEQNLATQGTEKQAVEMKLSELEATHAAASSTLADLQKSHSELQEMHDTHKSEATLRDNENAKAISKGNFDLETKVQIEEKLRAQILEHAESHKAS